MSCGSMAKRGRTVCLDLACFALNDFAQLRPFREVLEVKADVVGFGQVVKVAGVEL